MLSSLWALIGRNLTACFEALGREEVYLDEMTPSAAVVHEMGESGRLASPAE
jgi:hypothetical protein